MTMRAFLLLLSCVTAAGLAANGAPAPSPKSAKPTKSAKAAAKPAPVKSADKTETAQNASGPFAPSRDLALSVHLEYPSNMDRVRLAAQGARINSFGEDDLTG